MILDWPLMENNITREDLDVLIEFLKGAPILTQSTNVRKFEEEWSRWLGVKYSVFVNSGSSANLLSLAALKHLQGPGEVIVPPLTWVSDIASLLHCGHKPVFADISLKTLSMDTERVLERLNPSTRAVFVTYAQGFNALTDKLLGALSKANVPLIEDVSESHGATFKSQKLGSFGLMSSFSFYYAHHMSTIEGGMICTNDEKVYQVLRMLRSHGLVRESTSDALKAQYVKDHPDLNPEFIFAYPAYNVRNTEVGAVLGRHQLKRLNSNNDIRRRNFETFLKNLDSKKYFTGFALEGSCNYALNLILNEPDQAFCGRVMKALADAKVEFRRGSAGGGNQLRQPYLKGVVAKDEYKNYPVADHVHFFGFYIGNHPALTEDRVLRLCELLNGVG